MTLPQINSALCFELSQRLLVHVCGLTTVMMWPLPAPTCVSFTRSLTLAVQTCTMPERHEKLKNVFCITLHICMSSSTALNCTFCTTAATATAAKCALHPAYFCHTAVTGQK